MLYHTYMSTYAFLDTDSDQLACFVATKLIISKNAWTPQHEMRFDYYLDCILLGYAEPTRHQISTWLNYLETP